tara:strand:- start:911 stop:1207 length:297 start_codon:yes stop_codon:yes gene_type:complete
MKYKPSDLIFDPRINAVGMVLAIEEKTIDRMSVPYKELWYRVMFFGDEWCAKGNTRDYAVDHGDNILETYKEEEHKGKLREEANNDINDLSRVFIEIP